MSARHVNSQQPVAHKANRFRTHNNPILKTNLRHLLSLSKDDLIRLLVLRIHKVKKKCIYVI